jgi:hypothetical protein
MSDTASIRLPRTASTSVRPARARKAARTATRAARTATLAARSPRTASAAGTYVVVDAEYASLPAGTFTGTGIGRLDGTFVSGSDAYSARVAGSYVD